MIDSRTSIRWWSIADGLSMSNHTHSSSVPSQLFIFLFKLLNVELHLSDLITMPSLCLNFMIVDLNIFLMPEMLNLEIS